MSDDNKSVLIDQTVTKVLELDPPNIEWMTGELAHKLLSAFHGAHTMLFMDLLKRQIPMDEARSAANQQVPLLAFQLGMQVATDIEQGRQMREMFGE